MDKIQIEQVVQAQREFFRSGQTLDISWRTAQLKALRAAVLESEEKLKQALYLDLGKSATEAYLCDIGATVMEINEIIRGLRRWARPETHLSGVMCFPSMVTKVYKMPYGNCLIISPFNFPVLLTLGVLAAAMGGGNTAVLKVSSKTPNCSRALRELIAETFPENYITVVEGGHDVADLCLAARFDKIFYTGSPRVGSHVMHMAADHLTPVALELGGENGNWAIVRKDADLRDAARKIAFFKACNSGQICINVNQVAVAQEVCAEFIEELKREFTRQLGEDPVNNPEYPRLITDAAYRKCAESAEKYRDRIVFGGNGDPESRKFAPTILCPIGIDEEIVTRELFNPLLPVVPFPDAQIDRVLDTVASREHPLALYLFTSDRKWATRVMSTMQYGGGCVNEVCIHMMVKGVPFNGTGHSGMGAYHGVWGFREFTHPSAVLFGKTKMNLPLREHPYSGKGKWKEKIVKLAEK